MGLFDGQPSAEVQLLQRQNQITAESSKQHQGLLMELLAQMMLLNQQLGREMIEESQVVTFNNNPMPISTRPGLPYTGCYVADAFSGKKLMIDGKGGAGYSITLAAGWNQLNIDSESSIYTETAGDTVTVMFVWCNQNRNVSTTVVQNGGSVQATIVGTPTFQPVDSTGASFFTSGNPGYTETSIMGSNAINAALKMLTTSNTATPLPAVSCREITLIGLKKNGGTVYVGGSDVLHVDAPSTAPSLATSTTGGSLPAATYYVKFTWVTANGETVASPEASITTTGTTSTITSTISSLPAGVTSANMYIATSSNSETKQGSTTSTTYTQSAALVAGSALPVADTASKYGAALDPKDSETFAINNAGLLYIFGAAGDGVSYVAV